MHDVIAKDGFRVIEGNSLDVLPSFAECSFDSCVCDPPYELGFMGKAWDKSGIAYRVELWREVFRVLKPGAYLLAFGGSRTYHRMACAIEDAGFEIRDQIQWIYGSGFPKSLDVSKAIEKAAGVKPIAVTTQESQSGSAMGHGWNPTPTRWTMPELQTDDAKTWDGWGTALKPAHEPIVMARKPLEKGLTVAQNVLKWGTGAININSTKIPLTTGQLPSKIEAWENEKSLCNACADSVANPLKFGELAARECSVPVSAKLLNIEKDEINLVDTNKTDIGCSGGMKTESTNTNLNTDAYGKMQTAQSRPDSMFTTSTTTDKTTASKTCSLCSRPITSQNTNGNTSHATKNSPPVPDSNGNAENAGRWPSNVIHDGSDEVLAGFPEANHTTGGPSARSIGGGGIYSGGGPIIPQGYDDSGSAARFFYSPKASKYDREAGRRTMNSFEDPGVGNSPKARNHHPTVKPTDLMQYLCRLVTPAGGLVLDPFLGSGSTAKAALIERFRIVGIELNPEYAEIARARCTQLQVKLF